MTLLLTGSTLASSRVFPQQQAAHFCQLLAGDDNAVMPLSAHARRVMQPSDSLTAEQLFVAYLLHGNNWHSLPLFPHRQDDGTVVWYTPADKLPVALGNEHQKYVSEVFPRLIAEVQAGHWQAVDAYIDRMLEYQTRFGGSRQQAPPSPYTVIAFFLLITAAVFLCSALASYLSTRTTRKPTSA